MLLLFGEMLLKLFKKKLLILQKRALRLMHFANNRDHAVPFFKNTNNLPTNTLYVETVSKINVRH